MAEVVLSGVEKRFGEVAAVAGVDLTVKDREFVILVGPPAAERPPRSG